MNDIHKWIRSKYRSTNGHKPCVLNMNDRTHQTNRSFVHNQRTYRTFKIWPTSDVGVGLLHEIELHFLYRCTQSIIAVMHSSCVLFVCLRYICISDCLLNREPSCFPIHFFFERSVERRSLLFSVVVAGCGTGTATARHSDSFFICMHEQWTTKSNLVVGCRTTRQQRRRRWPHCHRVLMHPHTLASIDTQSLLVIFKPSSTSARRWK